MTFISEIDDLVALRHAFGGPPTRFFMTRYVRIFWRDQANKRIAAENASMEASRKYIEERKAIEQQRKRAASEAAAAASIIGAEVTITTTDPESESSIAKTRNLRSGAASSLAVQKNIPPHLSFACSADAAASSSSSAVALPRRTSRQCRQSR